MLTGPAGVSERKWLASDLWGESGRGGFGENRQCSLIRFRTPLSHVSPSVLASAQAATRSDRTGEAAAWGTLALGSEATSGRPRQRL